MTTDLTVPSKQEVALSLTDSDLTFIPNIKLLHGSSEEVADSRGHVGNFFFEDNELVKEFPIVVLAWREHAILMQNNEKKLESFHPNTDTWNKIAATTRNYPEDDPRMGYSFLIFLPSLNKYAIFHPNTPSARPVAVSIMNYMRPMDQRSTNPERELPFTNQFKLTSIIKKTKKFSFPIPRVIPIDPPTIEFIPKVEDAKRVEQLFFAPVNSEITEPTEENIER